MPLDNNQQFGPLDNVNISSISSPEKKHNYRMIVITVVVILIGIGGFLISQNENLQQSMKTALTGKKVTTGSAVNQGPVTIEPSAIANRELSWVEVKPEQASYSQNQTVVLNINASSEGKDITGYDLLIKVDSEVFDLKGVTSLVEGFTVFPFEKGTYISVTGIKDLNTQAPTIFADTPILKVELTPKKRGTTMMSVALSEGKEKTQLIDSDVNVLIPQIGSAQVDIN